MARKPGASLRGPAEDDQLDTSSFPPHPSDSNGPLPTQSLAVEGNPQGTPSPGVWSVQLARGTSGGTGAPDFDHQNKRRFDRFTTVVAWKRFPPSSP